MTNEFSKYNIFGVLQVSQDEIKLSATTQQNGKTFSREFSDPIQLKNLGKNVALITFAAWVEKDKPISITAHQLENTNIKIEVLQIPAVAEYFRETLDYAQGKLFE